MAAVRDCNKTPDVPIDNFLFSVVERKVGGTGSKCGPKIFSQTQPKYTKVVLLSSRLVQLNTKGIILFDKTDFLL